MCCILQGLTHINHDGMKKERGRWRWWWFKTKGPRKINTITLYSKNACKRHIIAN
jgi:hypothetical protein